MFPPSFRYRRAGSLAEAVALLAELGPEAKAIAGGQSLIPLMKLRLARPAALVDLNFVSGLSGIERKDGVLRLGALARHGEIAAAAPASRIPIVQDCAEGIADVQVRNRGTIGGSLAEADPSSDWGAVLLALEGEVLVAGPAGDRSIPLDRFVLDAFTTALRPGELVREVAVKLPPKRSGGAYLAFKRSAPVYATASVAVQLTLGEDDACLDARIVAGCVGLVALRLPAAEAELRRKPVASRSIEAAAEAAMAAIDPPADLRGSSAYKRLLVGALLKRAAAAAVRRARGESVEVSHEYVAR
ncbi:MAG TPA: xanthine dehydrogenase family protein subunit M [Candidatus Acidoferrales bacterium]|nr:xanthine dehydrogenase family protein subunit M [Candidatus Acidoferrales bacterium]